MNKKLIERIEQIFNQKLEAKTGWGKNEVKILLKEAIAEAALEFVDERN